MANLNLISPIVDLTPLDLDNLWQEAETLGNVYVRSTDTGWNDEQKRSGYSVKIIGRRRSTKIEVESKHKSLHCALADAINEGREMGLGEPS